jgi:hypothetical protein
VRSIANSISRSIEFSVPSTICSTIGSTWRRSFSAGAVGHGRSAVDGRVGLTGGPPAG